MKIKHVLLSSFLLVPALSFADVKLDIEVTVDETSFASLNAVATSENEVLYDNGYYKVEGKVVVQTDESADVELTVAEEDRVLAKSTFNLQLGVPATLEVTYESEECSCLDRDVELTVVARDFQ